MSELYRAKLNDLLTEFTYYLIEHPEFAERIADNAQVVLLDRHDPEYSRQAIEYAQKAKQTDDMPDRPVVYIEIGDLAPVRSRLQSLQVLESPPVYEAG